MFTGYYKWLARAAYNAVCCRVLVKRCCNATKQHVNKQTWRMNKCVTVTQLTDTFHTVELKSLLTRAAVWMHTVSTTGGAGVSTTWSEAIVSSTFINVCRHKQQLQRNANSKYQDLIPTNQQDLCLFICGNLIKLSRVHLYTDTTEQLLHCD